ncbi:hypothetical protein [Nonomuraea jiangxiensis]|uniref:Uncharacterized protein n=1 Tax=Nonomuraea jiangxiensis TaxID=633440 RepID=A0A1G9M634_9ACTN|nr:hypothetical protein [Nonomuraea jiangxiensis]SDL69603.1 hypothetical protein SAMN05421869_12973 [Nonomuraea jiangxiensis]
MFFEPPPAQEDTTHTPEPGLPAWAAPPADEMGAVMLSGLVLARSPNVTVHLPTIRAFGDGCLLNVDLYTRPHTLSPEDYQSLFLSVIQNLMAKVGGGRLPDTLLRFGVRFADGTKATTIGSHLSRRQLQQEPPPPGPRLSWLLGGVAMRSGDQDTGVMPLGLWLWPSPPPEPFELAVEWPAGGIALSIAELDGAAIASAARRSAPSWPDPT